MSLFFTADSKHCIEALSAFLVMGFLTIVFVGLGLFGMSSATCDTKYQNYHPEGTHTACISSSSKLLETFNTTKADQKEILDQHNLLRRNESAANMLKLSWDDELEMLAIKWAQQCNSGHETYNSQRDLIVSTTGSYTTVLYKVGQNVQAGYPQKSWTQAVNYWHSEIKDFKYNGTQTGEVGHYTQIVWAETFKVGCAMTKCSFVHAQIDHLFYTVCNYGPAGNDRDTKYTPFKVGDACDDCDDQCSCDDMCDCAGLLCQNGGVLDLNTCTCNCPNHDWIVQTDCSFNCTNVVSTCPFQPKHNSTSCSRFSNFPVDCPVMCSTCPDV